MVVRDPDILAILADTEDKLGAPEESIDDEQAADAVVADSEPAALDLDQESRLGAQAGVLGLSESVGFMRGA